MTKYLIVDVDGVLNSMKPTSTSFATTGLANGFIWPLNLDKNHAKWLAELAKETGSEMIWGTTWQDDANDQIGAQIGLPEMYSPPFGLRGFSQFNGHWKANGVLEYVGYSFGVWLDDDPDLWYYLQESNIKQVSVNDRMGLTEENIEEARQLLLAM